MKRLVLCMAYFLAAGCLFAAEEVNLPEGYRIIESTSPCTMVLTPYTTYPVLLQKYVPVTLFEGKWGSRPGQFGLRYTEVADEHRPMSLAVNSKNEIYILDVVNNRIQKFSPEGQYIKSISVRSFCDKDGVQPGKTDWSHAPYYNGMIIEIDSKDNLYFYVFKGEAWPEKQAELWEFHDDVLVHTWDGLPTGEFVVTPKDELMVLSYNKKLERTEKFNIRKQSTEEWFGHIISLPWFDVSFEGDRQHMNLPAKLFFHNPTDHSVIECYEYVPTITFPVVWVAREARMLTRGFLVYHHWKSETGKTAFYDAFNADGKLCSTTLLPAERIDFPRVTFDKQGNIYELVQLEHGMMVRKWEVKKYSNT